MVERVGTPPGSGLTLSRVHVMGPSPAGGETLIGTNLYKMFQRGVDKRVETYIAQGGRWWTMGGEEVAAIDVPEWVWNECRATPAEHRGVYRIVLPEERAEGKRIPTFEDAPEWPTKTDIMAALLKLDPAADADWTADGKPVLQRVKDVLGVYVSRERVNQVAPQFVRPEH